MLPASLFFLRRFEINMTMFIFHKWRGFFYHVTFLFCRTRKCNIIAVKFYAKVGNMNVEQVYEQVYVPKLKMRFDNICTELKSRF